MTTKILCDKCNTEGIDEYATTTVSIKFLDQGTGNSINGGIYNIEFDVCQKHFVESIKEIQQTVVEFR